MLKVMKHYPGIGVELLNKANTIYGALSWYKHINQNETLSGSNIRKAEVIL